MRKKEMPCTTLVLYFLRLLRGIIEKEKEFLGINEKAIWQTLIENKIELPVLDSYI